MTVWAYACNAAACACGCLFRSLIRLFVSLALSRARFRGCFNATVFFSVDAVCIFLSRRAKWCRNKCVGQRQIKPQYSTSWNIVWKILFFFINVHTHTHKLCGVVFFVFDDFNLIMRSGFLQYNIVLFEVGRCLIWRGSQCDLPRIWIKMLNIYGVTEHSPWLSLRI